MLYEKDKLEQYFRDEIRRVSDMQMQQLDEEINEIRSSTLAKMEQSAKKDADAACEQELRELQSEYTVRLSRLRDQTDRRLMQKRSELANTVFSEVIEKIQQYTQEAQYGALLESQASAMAQAGYPNVTIYLRKADASYAQRIRRAYGEEVDVQVDEEIRYGGLRLVSLQSGIVVDETFDARLSEQKEWFYQNSGLFVK